MQIDLMYEKPSDSQFIRSVNATSSPALYLIGGPNGAGKTTFARQFLPAIGVMEFLNADSIAAGLSPLAPAAAGTRAARLLLQRWREMVAKGESFGFESTLSGLTYARMIQEAKAEGYQFYLCYLSLATIDHSIRRVRERVKKGGHDVPVKDLRRRFKPSLRNFFQLYLPLADHAVLYDSTLQPPCKVAEWDQSTAKILSPNDYETILARFC